MLSVKCSAVLFEIWDGSLRRQLNEEGTSGDDLEFHDGHRMKKEREDGNSVEKDDILYLYDELRVKYQYAS